MNEFTFNKGNQTNLVNIFPQGVIVVSLVINFGYAAVDPGYRAFFSDRNPRFGRILDRMMGPRPKEEISPEVRKSDIQQFKESIQSGMK
jgi:hypothetical protein